jgi:ribose transport system permease protein
MIDALTQDTAPGAETGGTAPRARLARAGTALSFRNASALYIFAVIVIFFSAVIPHTFLAATTWRTLLDNQVVAGLAAMALLVPLSAGVFNLAIGLQVGAGSIGVAWLLVGAGLPVGVSVALSGLFGAVIGLVTALLVVQFRIDSFIATLGVSSLLAAGITAISGGDQILGVPPGLSDFGVANIGGVTYPFLAFVAVSAVLWYFLERTPAGRRVYATGGNIEAARLSGIHATRVIYTSLAICGVIAALDGVVLTARLGNADPTIGPGYLIPAFTAAFLGSTQFRGGRFNVGGTFVSVYVLAAGVKGLQLWGAPVWIPDAFNGASLLVAVGMAKFQGGSAWTVLRRALRRS